MLEATRLNGSAIDALDIRRLLLAMKCIFIVVAFLGEIAMATGSDFIATHWRKVR